MVPVAGWIVIVVVAAFTAPLPLRASADVTQATRASIGIERGQPPPGRDGWFIHRVIDRNRCSLSLLVPGTRSERADGPDRKRLRGSAFGWIRRSSRRRC
jgi:hypothetical protein